MNTKFSPVVKVRKQALDKIETSLAAARATREALQTSLELLREKMLNEKFPKSGGAQLIQLALASHNLLVEHKQELTDRLALNAAQIKSLEREYKTAYVELEKMRHLENEEIKKALKKIKSEEAKALDEIATQRFFAQSSALKGEI